MVPASYEYMLFSVTYVVKNVLVLHMYVAILQYSWLCTYVYGVTTSLRRVVLLYAVRSCSLSLSVCGVG
jgi:hypothetical protein